MSTISVVFDNDLTFSDIKVALKAPQDSEGGEGTGVMTPEAQTMIQGVCVPLLAINGIAFEIEQIVELHLYCTDHLPSIKAVINDNNHYLGDLNNPGRDNEIRLQILPPFDNAYKKINLTFFINNSSISGSEVTVSGKYKVCDLYNSRFNSFGKINTYDLFEQIAKDCKLGFASNCESNNVDERFIYANNSSYNMLMSKQIRQSGDETLVYDYWVDFWNNINLANIYERYHTKDPDEEMQVWVQKGYPTQIERDVPIEPVQQVALINNNPNETGPLKASSYRIISNTGKATTSGTDQVYTYYKNGEVIDTLVQDGSVKKDVFLKYEYLGENIGDFDYLISKNRRKSFLDIINCNQIEVTIDFPSLALMRGHQCVFVWYDNDFTMKNDMKNLGDIDTNIPIEDQNEEIQDADAFVINKQISGQYLIVGTSMNYNRGKWEQKLILIRPQDEQHKYMKDEDE